MIHILNLSLYNYFKSDIFFKLMIYETYNSLVNQAREITDEKSLIIVIKLLFPQENFNFLNSLITTYKRISKIFYKIKIK